MDEKLETFLLLQSADFFQQNGPRLLMADRARSLTRIRCHGGLTGNRSMFASARLFLPV